MSKYHSEIMVFSAGQPSPYEIAFEGVPPDAMGYALLSHMVERGEGGEHVIDQTIEALRGDGITVHQSEIYFKGWVTIFVCYANQLEGQFDIAVLTDSIKDYIVGYKLLTELPENGGWSPEHHSAN